MLGVITPHQKKDPPPPPPVWEGGGFLSEAASAEACSCEVASFAACSFEIASFGALCRSSMNELYAGALLRGRNLAGSQRKNKQTARSKSLILGTLPGGGGRMGGLLILCRGWSCRRACLKSKPSGRNQTSHASSGTCGTNRFCETNPDTHGA
jgi:hypothetical protein